MSDTPTTPKKPAKPIKSTGNMIVDNIKRGGRNGFIRKLNKKQAAFASTALLAKFPGHPVVAALATPEGQQFLQWFAPTALHFACSNFPERVPGAATIAPIMDKCNELAVADISENAMDVIEAELMPILAGLGSVVKEALESIPEALKGMEEITADEENEEEDVKRRAAAANAAAAKTLG